MALKDIVWDWDMLIAMGKVRGGRLIQKFGRNIAVPNGVLAALTIGGQYQTPKVLTSLRVKSTDALDNIAGTGGRKVKIFGIGPGYIEQEEEVSLNGLTPVNLSKQFYRVFRVYISESGSYASLATSSHIGQIVLEDITGTDNWCTIDTAVVGFGVGQSQIGAYTVPTGYTAFVRTKQVTVDTNKVVNVFFFQRQNIDIVIAPYTGTMRLVEQHNGVDSNGVTTNTKAPLLSAPEKTDIGFIGMGVGGTAAISVDFEIVLLDNTMYEL